MNQQTGTKDSLESLVQASRAGRDGRFTDGA